MTLGQTEKDYTNIEYTDLAEDDEVIMQNLFDENAEIQSTLKKPFGAYFDYHLNLETIEEAATTEDNIHYNENIWIMLNNKWLFTIPIWTNILRGKPDTYNLI